LPWTSTFPDLGVSAWRESQPDPPSSTVGSCPRGAVRCDSWIEIRRIIGCTLCRGPSPTSPITRRTGRNKTSAVRVAAHWVSPPLTFMLSRECPWPPATHRSAPGFRVGSLPWLQPWLSLPRLSLPWLSSRPGWLWPC
jgi:hypothetical protein